MRGRRIVFWGALAAALLLLLGTGNAAYLWVVLFGTAVFVLSAGHVLLTLRSLALTQELSHSAAAKGEEVRLRLALKSRVPFPLAHLTVRYRGYDNVINNSEKVLYITPLPLEEKETEETFSCRYSGRYPLGVTGISAGDLLGLLSLKMPERRLKRAPVAELVVYPGEGLSAEEEIPEGPRPPWPPSGENRRDCVLVDCSAHGLEEEAAELEDTIRESALSFLRSFARSRTQIRLALCSMEPWEKILSSIEDLIEARHALCDVRFAGEALLGDRVRSELEKNPDTHYVVITREPDGAARDALAALADAGRLSALVVILTRAITSDRTVKTLGEFNMRGVKVLTVFSGENVPDRLEVMG